MSINITEIRELVVAIAQTQIAEVNLKTESFHLIVRQGMVQSETVPIAPVAIAQPSPVVVKSSVTPSQPSVSEDKPPEDTTPTPRPSEWVAISAPMVGTFYRAPSPDDAPYVNVNDVIRNDQVVCIVEAMKLMNEIEAEVSGKVMEIIAENGEPVEYGQILMWVDPQ
ncbi:MAG: acetyl-CoA carboxylase biotin carboxyl carrier protein [Microcystaceae cyanobacterium]